MERAVADRPLAPATTSDDAPPVLAAHQLVVRFGALTAVDHVDVQVGAGQVVGLIGPNGAGKSTCLGAISGLVRATEGSVELQGEDVTKLAQHKRARRGLGRTFQNLEVFGSLTVLDNLLLAIAYADPAARRLTGPRIDRRARAHRERALDALQSVGIDHLAEIRTDRLAYAQKKLVEFARALAAEVKVLLLDEPMAGIAVEDRRNLIEVIGQQLSARNVAAIVVEHDMNVISSLCGYVYVMDSGSLIAQGSWANVVADDRVRAAYLGA